MNKEMSIIKNILRLIMQAVLLPGPVIVASAAGDTITLFECHRSAMETSPLHVQKELHMQASELSRKNHVAGWYPSVEMNGKYTWQNEVVEMPFPEQLFPGTDLPTMPHYNYKLSLDVQQTLYDGGISKRAGELELARSEVNRQKVEVGMNRLKGQVNNLYFYILSLQLRREALQLKIDEIGERMASLESLIRNEAVPASDLNILKAESLVAGQQLAEADISRRSAMVMLSELASLEISDESVLALPAMEIQSGAGAVLPEQALFELQIKNLDAGIRLTERQRYPKAFVFGQFGYGNPALDFFRDEFRGYYILGAGLNWRIWDWSKTSREKQVLAVQQDIIRSEKQAFDKDLGIRLEELRAGIQKYEEAVKRDVEILELRKAITKASASKLENGLITQTEYVSQLNAEIQARIQLDLHRVQLEQARINYLTGKGII